MNETVFVAAWPLQTPGDITMKVFFWIAFVLIVIIAIFAVQNSSASPVSIKFLLWKFETSLVYTILGPSQRESS